MTTNTNISQDNSTGCNFSTTHINSGVESTIEGKIFSTSSYRKSYIAWDNIERANKPKKPTDKTKRLGRNAQALLAVVMQKLHKKDRVILNHKYISTITRCEKRQNQNIIGELKGVLNIKYHNLVIDNGKKYRNSYVFSLKKDEAKNTSDASGDGALVKQKISSCYIYRENKNNNIRSNESNFKKNSSFSEKNKPSFKQTNSGVKSGFLGQGASLADMVDHLNEEMCRLLRSKCGRNFTDRAIKEIAKAVSRTKKGMQALFKHISGFVAYMTQVLKYEKRNEITISGQDYYIKANQTDSEKEIKELEKYLSEIEYSLQVSPEWHLKKKLAAVLERPKAYNLLTSYKSIKITEGRAVVELTRDIKLTNTDKEIILSQVQATHEKRDKDGMFQSVESLRMVMPEQREDKRNAGNGTVKLMRDNTSKLKTNRKLCNFSYSNKTLY